MKEDTFERSLRAYCQHQPFKPFVVELASGTRLTIDHPEALVYRGRAAMYIDGEGNFTLFDEGVTQLADISGNGTKRARKQA